MEKVQVSVICDSNQFMKLGGSNGFKKHALRVIENYLQKFMYIGIWYLGPQNLCVKLTILPWLWDFDTQTTSSIVAGCVPAVQKKTGSDQVCGNDCVCESSESGASACKSAFAGSDNSLRGRTTDSAIKRTRVTAAGSTRRDAEGFCRKPARDTAPNMVTNLNTVVSVSLTLKRESSSWTLVVVWNR